MTFVSKCVLTLNCCIHDNTDTHNIYHVVIHIITGTDSGKYMKVTTTCVFYGYDEKGGRFSTQMCVVVVWK